MPTNILALPELSMPCSIESNMDWLDSIVFFDAAGHPLALDGIGFHLQVRVRADLPDVLVDASTDNGLLQVLSSGFSMSLVAPGSGYALGDLIYIGGSGAVSPAVLLVTSVSIASFGYSLTGSFSSAQGAAGSGYAVGDIITLTPRDTSVPAVSTTPVKISVTAVDQNGNITGYSILSGGNYTSLPTGGGFLTPLKNGYTLQQLFIVPSFAITGVKLEDPGIFTTLPPNPAAQTSTTGMGVGATFSLSQTNNALGILIPADALVHPLIEAAGTYQIQAMADGYTQNVASGPMSVIQGIVR